MLSVTKILVQLMNERNRAQRALARLDQAISALRGVAGSNGSPGIGRAIRKPMSAAARKRIADAQKSRWAAWKANQKKSA